ncbi:MAG: fatty acid desaturase [Hyphomicrobiales bacterium]|nr:fatty acid desaturase [Hyphomicrobiales bacterium]
MPIQNDKSRPPTFVSGAEWPTLLLAATIYGGWLTLTWFQAALPWWILCPCGAWLVAWQGSLQHEVLHGHPTRWRRFNRLLALPALSLWLPYESYRVSHLMHHRDERLTDPLDDPESYYWTKGLWGSLNRVWHPLLKLQTTLAGRLLVGPAWVVPRFLIKQVQALWRGSPVAHRAWRSHLLPLALMLSWLVFVCQMNLAFYVFGIVYPAVSLALLRSFAEHRAASDVFERTAIVENAPILGLLYLYNNLHAAHHARPTLPWYEIPAWYRENREGLIAANGGLVYDGYLEVASRFLLRPYDGPLHPLDRAPAIGTVT